ncbi:TolC family protein [Parasediminibacterium paludis]|uniref:TolC family protein n=1 Tax=Parasediminibacterium paludis TaxID=908966 RepID=A0ABV8PUJ5_9BACT
MATFHFRRCYLLIALIIAIPASCLFAQQHLSLQNLIDTARKNLPLLQQKQAFINASKASITDIKHSFLPQVKFSDQLNMGSDNSIAGSYLPLGITPSTSAGVRSDNNFQPATGNIGVLYSEYELANFGLNSARLSNAQTLVNFSEADLEREAYLLELNIAKLYLNIQKEQYRLNADGQNIERYQSIFNVIRALTLSGLKAGSDSSLAKAELSKTRISYNQTLGSINQLKQQLAYLTGISANHLTIDTLANNAFISQPNNTSVSIDTVNNPLIDYYAKKKAIYVSNDLLIKKSYLPKIILAGSTWARGSSIQYNDQYKSLVTGLGYQRFNYAVGVAVTYNLFNNLYKKDKLAINRYQTQASDFELQQQKLAINSLSLQADNALQTTQANLQELPIQLQSAQATFAQKTAQYKAGLISLIDLTNASFVLYRSQTDYIETLSDWYLAQLDKAAATGNLNQFIQTIK